MRRGVKAAVWALFVLYSLVMLWLLFLRGRHPEFLRGYVENGIYWSLVRSTTNLVPFRTVADFLENIASGNDYLIRHAVVNLAGNVVMFVPLGLFLPLLFRRLRRYWRFLLVCALVIVVVETAQVLLTVGWADVDDLTLNLCGASIGFPFGLLAVKLLDKGGRET